jgi:hypothetical protein
MLVAKIRAIKTKATNTEQLVKDITQEIKFLDSTKKNLAESNSLLKRVGIVGILNDDTVIALERIQGFASRKQYRETAELLHVSIYLTKAYLTTFNPFKSLYRCQAARCRLCINSKVSTGYQKIYNV